MQVIAYQVGDNAVLFVDTDRRIPHTMLVTEWTDEVTGEIFYLVNFHMRGAPLGDYESMIRLHTLPFTLEHVGRMMGRPADQWISIVN